MVIYTWCRRCVPAAARASWCCRVAGVSNTMVIYIRIRGVAPRRGATATYTIRCTFTSWWSRSLLGVREVRDANTDGVDSSTCFQVDSSSREHRTNMNRSKGVRRLSYAMSCKSCWLPDSMAPRPRVRDDPLFAAERTPPFVDEGA